MSRAGGLMICGVTLALAAGCGGGDGETAATTGGSGGTGKSGNRGEEVRTNNRGQVPLPEGSSGEPPANPEERSAAAAARAYVRAIDRRDGARLCSLLAPAARHLLDLPVRRGGCGASVRASIGHVEGPGRPRWLGVRIASAPAVSGEGGEVRVTLTVAQRFARRPPVSIEDDVIYMRRRGDRWLVAKPSVALYRAIGVSDLPPSALAPP